VATKPLKELEPNEKGKVVKVGGRGSVHRRLLDMGLVAGTEVEVERVAPLGDPIEVKVKGYHLTLRKEEAANIQVEAV
jgi:Fe2+ transport system protein FeoA